MIISLYILVPLALFGTQMIEGGQLEDEIFSENMKRLVNDDLESLMSVGCHTAGKEGRKKEIADLVGILMQGPLPQNSIDLKQRKLDKVKVIKTGPNHRASFVLPVLNVTNGPLKELRSAESFRPVSVCLVNEPKVFSEVKSFNSRILPNKQNHSAVVDILIGLLPKQYGLPGSKDLAELNSTINSFVQRLQSPNIKMHSFIRDSSSSDELQMLDATG